MLIIHFIMNLLSPTKDIHQYGIDKNTFSPVNPSELSFMNPHLAAQLSEYNLFPYEYGRVTLIGNKTRIGSKFDPATLSLHSLVSNPGTKMKGGERMRRGRR